MDGAAKEDDSDVDELDEDQLLDFVLQDGRNPLTKMFKYSTMDFIIYQYP